jgi:hypothetical protein
MQKCAPGAISSELRIERGLGANFGSRAELVLHGQTSRVTLFRESEPVYGLRIKVAWIIFAENAVINAVPETRLTLQQRMHQGLAGADAFDE